MNYSILENIAKFILLMFLVIGGAGLLGLIAILIIGAVML